MDDLRTLLDPVSIAVVGASPRGNRGLQIIENLQRFGSSARIYPVHPRETTIAGLTAYPDAASLPETCEFVAIALDADRSLDVLEEFVAAGTRAGSLIASGFGEGGSGAEQRRRLDDILTESGFLLCGPNCYGILNATSGFAAYSGQLVEPFTRGNVALVMQSGALTHSVTDSAVGRGLGLSHLITTGNEAGVGLGRYVRALAQDEQVGVIGLFIEGLRDVEEFSAAAIEAAEAGKPVVALTVGRSALGQQAALAHTGAIAGQGSALAGLLRRCHVVQVGDLDEFRETLLLFSAGLVPSAPAAAITSISGGGTGLLADLSEDLGLPVAELSGDSRESLAAALPGFATVANPLDLTGASVEDPTIAIQALDLLKADPGVGVVALALNVLRGSAGQESLYREQADLLAKCAANPGAPVLTLSLTTGAADDVVVDTLTRSGVPVLSGARASIAAITAWLEWHRRGRPAPLGNGITDDVVSWDGGPVAVGAQAMDLLADAGVPTPASILVSSAAEAVEAWDSLASPVVLKLEAAGLSHKTEVGGVVTSIGSCEQLVEEVSRMRETVRTRAPGLTIDGFLLQEQVQADTVECIVGVVRDPQVGLVLTVAPGGVLAELMGPAATVPVPAARQDIEELIDSSPLATLLDGYRGAAAKDRSALVDLVERFGRLAARCGPDLAAAELNPVLVGAEGDGAVAVDALFVKEES